MIRALIVDDEEPARRRLATLLAEAGDVEVVGSCPDGVLALDAIAELRPDLLFLDIQMPEMDGFEVLRAAGVDAVPAVVFVTAYEQHALRAFDAHAIDYLLKPFTHERFEQMLARARRVLAGERAREHAAELRSLLAAQEVSAAPTRLAARDGERVVLVNVADILWIGSDRNYAIVHTAGRSLRLRGTLRELGERLAPAGFRRLSHSALVNSHRISTIEPAERGEANVLLDDGTTVRTSRSYHRALDELR